MRSVQRTLDLHPVSLPGTNPSAAYVDGVGNINWRTIVFAARRRHTSPAHSPGFSPPKGAYTAAGCSMHVPCCPKKTLSLAPIVPLSVTFTVAPDSARRGSSLVMAVGADAVIGIVNSAVELQVTLHACLLVCFGLDQAIPSEVQ